MKFFTSEGPLIWELMGEAFRREKFPKTKAKKMYLEQIFFFENVNHK